MTKRIEHDGKGCPFPLGTVVKNVIYQCGHVVKKSYVGAHQPYTIFDPKLLWGWNWTETVHGMKIKSYEVEE